MLKITKITDYGFVLLAHMASNGEENLYSAKELAAASKLALPTVSKVLKILTQGEILVSHQGSKGGYALSKPADQIAAASIIEAIEGPLAITDCSGDGCTRGGCRVGVSWRKVNQTVVDALSDLSLADMARSNES